jgi:hypothetical protein
MITNCLILSRVGDYIIYRHRFGTELISEEIVAKRYAGFTYGTTPYGLYPVVSSALGERVIHPDYYVVHKIYRKTNKEHKIW